MGHNSTLLICNDAMGAIDRDPAGWWAETKHALYECAGEPVTYGFGGYANYFHALTEHHADVTSLIAVGGNGGSVIWQGPTAIGHDTPEGQVELLRVAAESLGYHLVKNSKTRIIQKARQEETVMQRVGMRRSGDWVRFMSSKIDMLKNLAAAD